MKTNLEQKKLCMVSKSFFCSPLIVIWVLEHSRMLCKKLLIFHSCRWGSSVTVSAGLTVRSAPHRHKRKFSGAHVTFKHLPQPLRSHFGTLGQLFLKRTKNAPQRTRGGHQIFLGVNIFSFCENEPHVKFQNSN